MADNYGGMTPEEAQAVRDRARGGGGAIDWGTPVGATDPGTSNGGKNMPTIPTDDAELENQLRAAGYNGPFDHDSMAAAWNRANSTSSNGPSNNTGYIPGYDYARLTADIAQAQAQLQFNRDRMGTIEKPDVDSRIKQREEDAALAKAKHAWEQTKYNKDQDWDRDQFAVKQAMDRYDQQQREAVQRAQLTGGYARPPDPELPYRFKADQLVRDYMYRYNKAPDNALLDQLFPMQSPGMAREQIPAVSPDEEQQAKLIRRQWEQMLGKPATDAQWRTFVTGRLDPQDPAVLAGQAKAGEPLANYAEKWRIPGLDLRQQLPRQYRDLTEPRNISIQDGGGDMYNGFIGPEVASGGMRADDLRRSAISTGPGGIEPNWQREPNYGPSSRGGMPWQQAMLGRQSAGGYTASSGYNPGNLPARGNPYAEINLYGQGNQPGGMRRWNEDGREPNPVSAFGFPADQSGVPTGPQPPGQSYGQPGSAGPNPYGRSLQTVWNPIEQRWEERTMPLRQQDLSEWEAQRAWERQQAEMTGRYNGQQTLAGQRFGLESELGRRSQALAEQQAAQQWQFQQAQMAANPENAAAAAAYRGAAPWQQGMTQQQPNASRGNPIRAFGQSTGQTPQANNWGVPEARQMNYAQYQRMGPDQQRVMGSYIKATGRSQDDYEDEMTRYAPQRTQYARGRF